MKIIAYMVKKLIPKIITIVVIFAVMNSYAYADGVGKGFISGRAVLASGKPMQNAVLLLYAKQNGPAPLPERYWRVPESVVPIGSDGKFNAELTEGEYYVGAIGRESSKLVPGPPAEGDILVLVKDRRGIPKLISVTDGKTIDIGTQKGSPYLNTARNKHNKITSVEGTITLADGKPASGVFVFAFHSPERGSKPIFASEKTDRFGKYVLRVDGDGTFYLKARDVYGGGRPQNGQLIGTFGDDNPIPVVTKAGNITKGINFEVQSIQRPDGK